MSKEAIAHYEAALKEAFPRGATGEVFHHWNEARYLIATEALDRMAENARELGLDYEPAQQEPVPAAMKTVIQAMQQDPDYAWSWHCNIAMAFVDAGGDHYTGNQGAARFMKMLANVEPAHELPSPQPAQQEPVVRWDSDGWGDLLVDSLPDGTLLYTSPPAQQEPVATLWQHGETGRTRITMPEDITDCDARWFKAADLYTSPPAQRTWVGLSDEEIAQGNKESWVTEQAWQSAVWWAEAKLKEKNGL